MPPLRKWLRSDLAKVGTVPTNFENLKAVFKNTQQLTDDQENYLNKVIKRLEEGGLAQANTKTT